MRKMLYKLKWAHTHKTQNTYTDSKLTSQKQFFYVLERKNPRFSVVYLKVC